MKDNFNNAVGPQMRSRKNWADKIIPALAILSLASGMQVATQFFASDFKYQAALGQHIRQVYPPWSILQWAGKWYGQYPDAFMRAGSIGIAIASIGLIEYSQRS